MDKHNRKYNTNTGLENFILRLKECSPNIEYFDGYKTSEDKVLLICKVCGNIFERYASCVRKGKTIRCYECEKYETKKRIAAEKNHLKAINKLNKESKKFLKNSQMVFNVCDNCGSLFVGSNKYCSKRCADRRHEHIKTRRRIERARKNGAIDNDITLDKLIKRDNNICYICNKECNLLDYVYKGNVFIAGNYYPSIDHVIPISKGGTHTWENVKLSHFICNSLKSDS